MDRETALAELRKAAGRIINEAFNTNFFEKITMELDTALGNENDENVVSSENINHAMEYSRKIGSECLQHDKLSNLTRKGLFIIPVRTKEDIRQNNYKIKEECFDYWKYKQVIIDDMISDALSGEYGKDTLLEEIRRFNALSVEDIMQLEKRGVDIWLEELDVEKYLETVNQIFADENENNRRTKVETKNIPEG